MSRYHLISNKNVQFYFCSVLSLFLILPVTGRTVISYTQSLLQKSCSEATFHKIRAGFLSAGENPLCWRSFCVLLFIYAFHLSFIIGGFGGNVKENMFQSFIPKPEPVVSHSEPLPLRRTLIAVPEGKLRPLGTDGVLNSSS